MRCEVAGKVVEKEFPFRHPPKAGLFVVVKTNHERGDEIELFAEIGQGNEWADTRYHATDAE